MESLNHTELVKKCLRFKLVFFAPTITIYPTHMKKKQACSGLYRVAGDES